MSDVKFKKFNFTGIAAYIAASAVAYFSPGVPPINGILAAIVAYVLFDLLFSAVGFSQDHEVSAGA
jgi:cytosine permease